MQTYAVLFQAEDGIRDYKVTGVQTCALLFQAEDGIRDYKVTGVQTCALPIYVIRRAELLGRAHRPERSNAEAIQPAAVLHRSEERRVGKEGRSRWSPDH